MIWDEFFLTRVATVYCSVFVGCVWLVGGFFQFGFLHIRDVSTIAILLVMHSVGLGAVSAGFFGRRYVAFVMTFTVGLLWFTAVALILWGNLSRPIVISAISIWEIFFAVCLGSSGLMLFFITYLLVRTSRYPPNHFRTDF